MNNVAIIRRCLWWKNLETIENWGFCMVIMSNTEIVLVKKPRKILLDLEAPGGQFICRNRHHFYSTDHCNIFDLYPVRAAVY